MAHELSMGDDGILRLGFIGNINKEKAEAFIKEIIPFLEAATEAEPLLALADSSRTGKVSSAARKIFTEMYRDSRFKKVAVVEASRYARVLAGFLIKATGRASTLRFFDSEEEAVAWLKAKG
jgi:hypothetical protein